jgi:hypothetical protein
MASVETANPRLRACPHKAVFILSNAIDSGACQAFLYIIMSIAIFLREGGIR